MTFTLVNETYDKATASRKISHLMLAFAVTPGLAVALGGFLNQHFAWTSCFYASALYGALLLCLVTQLPETLITKQFNALSIQHLVQSYSAVFKNKTLIAGGILMGSCTAFVYSFAATTPFIAMNLFSMTPAQYGLANLLPPVGLILGSLYSPTLIKKLTL